MANNSMIKPCHYRGCPHPRGIVNIKTHRYVVDGKKFYHPDCYHHMLSDRSRSEKTRTALEHVKDLWLEYISPDVHVPYLMKVLQGIVERGVDPDYMVFAMRYIVDHRMNLRYPQGFKFFLERGEIREAYARSRRKKVVRMVFSVIEPQQMAAPQSCASPKPARSFADILGESYA